MTGVTVQVRLTVELKPPEGVIVTVDVAEPPGVTVAGASGAAVSANDGAAAAVTVRLAVVVWTSVPEVPVIVKLKGPPTLDAVVVTISGTLNCPPPPDWTKTEAGEQEDPEGSPEQVTITVPANSACGFT